MKNRSFNSIKLIIFSFALFVVILFSNIDSMSGHTKTKTADWGYTSDVGPLHWGELSAEFATCQVGQHQSPIDIGEDSKLNMKKVSRVDFDPLQFNYQNSPLKIINNGHTIEIEYEKGSSLRIGNELYELKQFHFHSPSEHTIDGRSYPMVAHLVHKSQSGKIAVVGVFMKMGKQNDFLQSLWDNLPTDRREKTIESNDFNATGLLPSDLSYYHYLGSLTTPPCSEGVNWFVLENPIEISPEQIAKFISFYSWNSRPTQPLNQRVIEEKIEVNLSASGNSC